MRRKLVTLTSALVPKWQRRSGLGRTAVRPHLKASSSVMSKKTRSAVVLALLLAAPVPTRAAGIDLEAANRLVGDYFRHIVEGLPRDWRRAEEEKMRTDPPRIEAGGIFQITAPAGQLAFEYDAANRLLHCYAVIHKPRQEMTMWGLDRQGIQTALDRAVAAGAPTGGGELIWDAEAAGFFLRRTFSDEPRSSRQMTRELDRLLAAGEAWFRQRYREALESYVETLAPPASATGRDGELAVTILLTHDKRYQDLWRKPAGALQPRVVTVSEFTAGQEVWALALFTGARPDAEGLFRYKAQYSFVYPDGSEHGSPVGNLWWSEPPPADHLQMSEMRAAIEVTDTTQPGDYLARIKACDAALERCVTAQTPFRVVAPPAR